MTSLAADPAGMISAGRLCSVGQRLGFHGHPAAVLAFGPADPGPRTFNLSPKADLAEAAANLFSHLRAADRTGPSAIAVAPIPAEGLGEAINDRLKRAAGFVG